jgi:hypothetical protein
MERREKYKLPLAASFAHIALVGVAAESRYKANSKVSKIIYTLPRAHSSWHTQEDNSSTPSDVDRWLKPRTVTIDSHTSIGAL